MYENLPPAIKIRAYKEKIGDERKIIRFIFDNQEFYFKTITQGEYQNILMISDNDQYLIQENICQAALIEPEDYIFSTCNYAGLPQKISEIILNNSLFNNVNAYQSVYMQYKNEMNEFKNQCIAIIKSQFNEFTFEEMEEWPLEKLFKYVSRAEYIFNLNKADEEKINLELSNDLEETENEEEKTKDEIYDDMISVGVDPVLFESRNITFENKDLKNGRLLGGAQWKNEEIVNEIRGQLEKSDTKL